MIKRYKMTIFLLAGVIIGLILGIFIWTPRADAKEVKEYLGEWYISSYSAEDNTPSGTHSTASGKYATAGRTAAVDKMNPLVPMGSVIEIEGLGRRIIEDVGGFGRYNGGRRAIDIFTDGDGFLIERGIWLIREETKEEKEKRLQEEADLQAEMEADRRAELIQTLDFQLVADDSLPVGTIATDPQYIKGGTVQIGECYYEVAKTNRHLGRVIKVSTKPIFGSGYPIKILPIWVKVKVWEGAKG